MPRPASSPSPIPPRSTTRPPPDTPIRITVQASDGTLTSSQTFTIAVTDVAPSAPVDSNARRQHASRKVRPTARPSASPPQSTDLERTGDVTYSLIGDTSLGGFTINAATGVVTVADGSKIDYESAAGHAYTVTVQASDGALVTIAGIYHRRHRRRALVPVDSDGAANTVAEGAANGSHRRHHGLVDRRQRPGRHLSALIGDTSGGGFTINAATGVVTVADSTKIDYETAAGHAYTVTAQASDGTLASSQTFTIACD